MAGHIRMTRRSRVVAGIAALALVASGTVAYAPPAAAAYPESFNPFAIAGGFTVYAREDGSFGNTETEGSIAVGGTMTKPGDGQYTLVHVVAGTGDYTLPTVDGDPTRLLAGSYSPESGGITAITSAGTSESALFGDLKLVTQDGPFEAFARADWLRLGTDPTRPDQTPLIDATHQRFPDDAAPPSGSAGDGSIYTVNTGPTAVAEYVEAQREASWSQASQCFADIADPTLPYGNPVAVAESLGDRVVLEPLRDDRPNVVDYADIAGAALVQFSAGPEPSVTNPLVIRVPAGTSDVVGARFDPQGAYSPYVVWDLSALSGAVSVTAGQERIDGSIYAPDADVTVDAAPLDGQIIGNDVTTRGGEIHSFMFAGEIACAADEGGFRIRKQLEGIASDDPLLDDVSFAVNYTATSPDGAVEVGHLVLPSDGSWVDPGDDFPIGTSIAFEEIAPPSIDGYTWSQPVITPNPLIVGDSVADVVIDNVATAATGTFTVSKSIVDESGVPVTAPGTVPVSWTARQGATTIASGTLDLPLDGTTVEAPQRFPSGTRVTFDEDLAAVTPPPGYDWSGASWAPGRTIEIGTESPVAIELTNLVTPSGATPAPSIVKHTEGVPANTRFQYAISYNVDPTAPGAEERRTRELPTGRPISLSDIETGSPVLELAELVPLFDGAPVDVTEWEPPLIRVTSGGVTTDYEPAGFEGEVPLEDAIVDIPVADSADLEIEFVNVRDTGSFSISKELVGIDPGALPPGALFTVGWTATDPLGAATSGTLALPADGSPVSPLDIDGAPVQFADDTVVTFTEQTPPAIDGVTWQTPTFSPASVVIGESGERIVAATVTNTADLETGTFEVAKELVGISTDQIAIDDFTVGYLALEPGGDWEVGSFVIPVDGSPASPVDDAGQPLTFPLGTHVLLAEATPEDDALPTSYEWALPVWSPSRWISIDSEDETPRVTVTNTAVEYAEVSLTKLLENPAGIDVSGLTYDVEWWLDGEAQPTLTLEPGQTVTGDRFPVGSILEASEPALVDPPGGTWDAPEWSIDGEALPVQDNGRVVGPVSSRDDGVIAFTVENRLRADAPTPPVAPTPPSEPSEPSSPSGALPATGGSVPVVPIAVAALLLLVGGAIALLARRRRSD